MRTLNLIFILVLIQLVSCSTTRGQLDGTVVKMADIPQKNIVMDDVFCDFEYVSLETTEQSLFGDVNKLIVHDQTYFILDYFTKKLYVFREDGSFSHTIGKVGEGPGEYTHLNDFVIDEKKQQIVILSHPSVIYRYDMAGNFIAKKMLDIDPIWKICNYDEGFIGSNNQQSFAQGQDSLLYFFDEDFNVKNAMGTSFPNSAMPPFVNWPFLKGKENIAYFDALFSKLYFPKVDGMDDSKSIQFILPKPIPEELFSDGQKMMDNQNDYSFFLSAYLSDSILWTRFADQGKQYVFLKDFKSDKQILSWSEKWWPEILYESDGYFYTAINDEWILENIIIPSAKQLNKYPIGVDSNPVILRFKPKPLPE
ncbi:MAG: 6-bladed beta-propeller [Bacteroidales bacterium]|jgi:hypothetical protein|nr:6-bladed beta-propeller [Bacteroidales bacterium]